MYTFFDYEEYINQHGWNRHMNVANIKEVRIVCLFSKNVLEWNA